MFAAKAAAAFFVLLALYCLLLRIVPGSDDGPGLYDTNVLKAQNYVLKNGDYDAVLVGSSMGSVVPIGEHSDRYFNMAFSGGCSLSGMEIIETCGEETGHYPDVVFVEISDALANGVDEDLIGRTRGIGMAWFNRIANRPDYLFYSLVKAVYYRNKEKNATDYAVMEDKLAFWLNAKSKAVDQEEMDAYIALTKEQVDKLKEKGCRVILLEIPNHQELHDLAECVQLRETALRYMPEDSYEWFCVDWADYVVPDAIHMGKHSAKMYTEKLVETVLQ
ncbi:MAG: hypothetical protein K6E50_08940 [Lachnospiraceae bacterium]|nr:hypothetical protein [Lachnospiraceae bacterium]